MKIHTLNQPAGESRTTHSRAQRAGVLVFTFFLVKGLIWLTVPFWIWLGVS